MTDNPERSAEMHPHPSAEPEPAFVLNAAGAGSSIKPPQYKTKRTDNWTDERIKQLTRRWADGASCSVIAAEFGGLTRNAVIGKLHRLGLSAKKVDIRFRSSNVPPAPKRQTDSRQRRIIPWVKVPLKPTKLTMPNPVTFMELASHHCRFPIHHDGEPTLFCGNWVAIPKISYCAGHCRIAYQPARSR